MGVWFWICLGTGVSSAVATMAYASGVRFRRKPVPPQLVRLHWYESDQ